MSSLYYFIATRTTYDVAVPTIARDQAAFNRDVAGAFRALAGGWIQAGDLKIRTTASVPANHLLCDGSTVNRIDFPQLAEALGVAESATTFTLPNFIGTTPEVAAEAPAQTIEGGTVVTEDTVVTEPSAPSQTGGSSGGNVISGGRSKLFGIEDLRV